MTNYCRCHFHSFSLSLSSSLSELVGILPKVSGSLRPKLDPRQLTDIDGNPRELEPGEKPLELSTSCKDFVEVNKACDSEIEQFCQGMYYHGDTMTCLTQWTSQSDLSSGCVAALPKKGSGDDDEVDAEKAAWRAKKKAARQAAMDAIEKELGVHEIILSNLSPFPLPGTCLQTMVQRLESIESSEETLGDGGLLVPSLCFMSDPFANSSQIAKGPR
ncbi:HMCN1 [Symbiodinium necroappetens]|uniref:HMCN1 protein n=1 Tax=Symbiodinium necroappetens TaxID=1628268 RepID=A0A812Z863_9DINO|nr:HMCN1 [Symbiodinium necroappetens]